MAKNENGKERETEKERRKKNKMGYMIISVIISMIIWGMVAYTTDPDVSKTLHNVTVRFVGEDTLKARGLIVTGADELPDLSVKISGKRSDMVYAIDNVVVEFDVSGIETTGVYELEGAVVLPNSRINLERIRFDTVPITIDEYEEKDISIEIRQMGVLRNKLVKSESETKSVTISGAKSEVDNVASGYASVDISKLDGDREIRTNFVMLDHDDNLISRNETIETETPDIVIENTVYDTAELKVEPILSDSLDEMYVLDSENTLVTPETLTVGVRPGSSFGSVKAVITGTGAGDYEVMEEDGMYIPDNISKVYIDPKMYSRTLFTRSVEVTALNLADGLFVTGSPSVDATFYGDETKADTISAQVDAAGLAEGTYVLPIHFEGEGILPDGEYSAEIVITRQSGPAAG